jgi:hypothetical protein
MHLNSSNIDGISVNICNDTFLECNTGEDNLTIFNSIAIYRTSKGECIRIAGQFFNDKNYLKKVNDELFIYNSTGDICRNNINFSTLYKFQNTLGQESVQYRKIPVPYSHMNEACDRTLEINVNFDDITDQLLIQKFFSNYHYLTGIIFFAVGVYLLIFAKYKKITKFLNCIIFGEIFTFTFGVGIFGIHYIHMEWAFFIIGLVIGLFLGYFCLGGSKLYRVILALTAGFIFGIIFFDIIFTHLCSRLSEILFTDTVIIFMSLFVLILTLQHSFHYFYDSIIGSYIFVRGICLLFKDVGKYARYRELNLLLYLIGKNEIELAKYYYNESWPIYYVYIIIMFLIMGGSIFYYYLKLYKKDEEDLSEKDENMQKELLKEKTTAGDDDKDLD